VPKVLARYVALFLVPCLLADPTVCHGLNLPSSWRLSQPVKSLSLFDQQAFVLPLAAGYFKSWMNRIATLATFKEMKDDRVVLVENLTVYPDGTVAVRPFNFGMFWSKRTKEGSSSTGREARRERRAEVLAQKKIEKKNPQEGISRRNALIGGGGLLAVLAGWGTWLLKHEKPIPVLQTNEDIVRYLQSEISYLVNLYSKSSDPEHQQWVKGLSLMHNHVEPTSGLDEFNPAALFVFQDPEGHYQINSKTGYPGFKFRINPQSIRELSGQTDPLIRQFIRSVIMKELGGLEYARRYPYLGRSHRLIEKYYADAIRVAQVTPGVSSDEMKAFPLRELIKHDAAYWARYESEGYVMQLRYLEQQSITPEAFQALTDRSPRLLITREGLKTAIVLLQHVLPQTAEMRYWVAAQLHIKSILETPNVAATAARTQYHSFRRAYGLESFENPSTMIPGHLRPRIEATLLPSPHFLAYLRDPDYYAPTPDQVMKRFGQTSAHPAETPEIKQQSPSEKKAPLQVDRHHFLDRLLTPLAAMAGSRKSGKTTGQSAKSASAKGSGKQKEKSDSHVTRRWVIGGLGAAGGLGMIAWVLGRENPDPMTTGPVVSVPPQPVTLSKEKMVSFVQGEIDSLIAGFSKSKNPEEQQWALGLALMRDRIEVKDHIAQGAQLAVFTPQSPAGDFQRMKGTDYPDFSLQIASPFLSEVVDSDPDMRVLVRSMIMKELGGLEYIRTHFYIGKSQHLTEALVKQSLQPYKRGKGYALTPEIMSDPTRKALIKRAAAIVAHLEAQGYVAWLRYLENQAMTPARLREIANRYSQQVLVNAISNAAASMLEAMPASEGDRPWQTAQYHIQQTLLVTDDRTNSAGYQKMINQFAFTVEFVEGRARHVEGAPHPLPFMDPQTHFPRKDFMGYLRDSTYFAPTPEEIIKLFGEPAAGISSEKPVGVNRYHFLERLFAPAVAAVGTTGSPNNTVQKNIRELETAWYSFARGIDALTDRALEAKNGEKVLERNLKKVGLPRSALDNLRKGIAFPTETQLRRLATVFGESTEYLFPDYPRFSDLYWSLLSGKHILPQNKRGPVSAPKVKSSDHSKRRPSQPATPASPPAPKPSAPRQISDELLTELFDAYRGNLSHVARDSGLSEEAVLERVLKLLPLLQRFQAAQNERIAVAEDAYLRAVKEAGKPLPQLMKRDPYRITNVLEGVASNAATAPKNFFYQWRWTLAEVLGIPELGTHHGMAVVSIRAGKVIKGLILHQKINPSPEHRTSDETEIKEITDRLNEFETEKDPIMVVFYPPGREAFIQKLPTELSHHPEGRRLRTLFISRPDGPSSLMATEEGLALRWQSSSGESQRMIFPWFQIDALLNTEKSKAPLFLEPKDLESLSKTPSARLPSLLAGRAAWPSNFKGEWGHRLLGPLLGFFGSKIVWNPEDNSSEQQETSPKPPHVNVPNLPKVGLRAALMAIIHPAINLLGALAPVYVFFFDFEGVLSLPQGPLLFTLLVLNGLFDFYGFVGNLFLSYFSIVKVRQLETIHGSRHMRAFRIRHSFDWFEPDLKPDSDWNRFAYALSWGRLGVEPITHNLYSGLPTSEEFSRVYIPLATIITGVGAVFQIVPLFLTGVLATMAAVLPFGGSREARPVRPRLRSVYSAA
jgi:hypothetical protein